MIFTPVLDVRNRAYCGPSAVMLLTGVPLSRVEKMFRRARKEWGGTVKSYNGKTLPIKGTWPSEVVKVLKRLGCKVNNFNVSGGSLAAFVEDTRNVTTPFLINVTGHYMVSFQGMIADSTYKAPIKIEDYPRGARRVKKAWRIEAPERPRYSIDDQIAADRAPKPKKDVKVTRAEKIAKDIKRWERKEKLAKTKLKKLRQQQKRYQKQGIVL